MIQSDKQAAFTDISGSSVLIHRRWTEMRNDLQSRKYRRTVTMTGLSDGVTWWRERNKTVKRLYMQKWSQQAFHQCSFVGYTERGIHRRSDNQRIKETKSDNSLCDDYEWGDECGPYGCFWSLFPARWPYWLVFNEKNQTVGSTRILCVC